MCKFDHIAITVKDLNQSVEWYCHFFGFKEIRRFEKSSLAVHGATLQLGDFILEILQPYNPHLSKQMNGGLNTCLGKIGANHLAFNVNNVEEMFQKLLEAKTRMISDIIDSKYFFCLDPDCVMLELRQVQ